MSTIETILEKDNFTLEELLDEDELLQECRAENLVLLNFLTKPATLTKLINYVTTEPEQTADSVRKFKYPFISCEILCSDVWPLVEAVYTDPIHLEKLYGFLMQPPPLNAAVATHVSKVAGALLEKKGPETLQFLRNQPNLVDHFISHLSSSAVMDLLLKIISSDQDSGATLEWLCQSNLITKLVSKFEPGARSAEVQEHAAQALSDIVQVSVLNKNSQLMAQLESRAVVETLLDHMFAPGNGTALYFGLDVMTELVSRSVGDGWQPTQEPPAVLQVMLSRLPVFVELLR